MTLTPATIRQDLKCGKGSISQGEKCHVATATSTKGAQPTKRKRAPNATFTEKALKTAGVVGGLGSLGYTVYAVARGNNPRAWGGLSGIQASSAAINYGSSMEYQRKGQKTKAARARAAAAVNVAGAAAFGAGAHISGKNVLRRRAEVEAARQAATAARAARAAYAKQQAEQWAKQQAEHQERQRKFWEEFNSKYGSTGSRSSRSSGYHPSGSAYDPFKDLGITETASDSEVKKAWLKGIRTHHPDVGGDPEAAKRTNAAYHEIRRRRGLADSNLDSDLASVWAYGFQP